MGNSYVRAEMEVKQSDCESGVLYLAKSLQALLLRTLESSTFKKVSNIAQNVTTMFLFFCFFFIAS